MQTWRVQTIRRQLLIGFIGGIALIAAGLGVHAAAAERNPIVVFATASLKNALDAIAADWRKESGDKVTIAYGASPALAKQIEQDAPAHMFISADLDWMDYVAQKKLIRSDSRVNLLGNRIVLIAPKGKSHVNGTRAIEIKPGFDLAPNFDLAKLLGDGRLAIANVASVPAGKYGKAALEKLELWTTVVAKLAQTENVRAALLLVSRGEAAAGIVYRSDAASDPSVAVIGTFPETSHPAIVYPAALTAKAAPDAAAFLAYLRGPKAKAHFEAQGFSVLNQNATN